MRNRAGLADAAATLRIIGSTEVSSEWMHLLFLKAPINMALLEGRDHRFVAVNDRYRRTAAPRELIGMTFRDAFSDIDVSAIVHLLDDAFTSGESRSASGVIVEPMRRADGSVGGVILYEGLAT